MVSSKPITWSSNEGIISDGIKTARPDIVEFADQDIINNAEVAVNLLFENIGAQELLTISRHDMVNGEYLKNGMISNLGILSQEYNSNNIIKTFKIFPQIFNGFPIKLFTKIPSIGNGLNKENVYMNTSGDIIIELINVLDDEQIEIEMIANGTIDEVNIS